MNHPKKIGLIITLILVTMNYLVAQEREKIIPDKLYSVLAEGLESRETRSDIPFKIIKHLYLPARSNVHSIFIFRLEKAKEGSSFGALVSQGKTNFHVFLQFYRLINDAPFEVLKEVYIPKTFQLIENADEEDFYTTCYPLPPGDYLLSMAIASQNLELIGTQYFEFSLPNMNKKHLNTTPIFFVKNIERMSSPETKVEVHKGFFTYSILKIKPNLNNLFSLRDNLNVFYFIYGSKSNALQVSYYVLKDSEKVIDYGTMRYDSPLISQLLPPVTEHNLSSGIYTLSLDITDISSDRSINKRIIFEVK